MLNPLQDKSPLSAQPQQETSAVEILASLWQAGITFVSGVADSGVKELIAALESTECGRRYVLATREDNAVALATGAYLAGERPLVFMESAGVGNIVDVLTSLVSVYRVPLVLLVVWAGYKGRDVPHHNSIGEHLEGLFAALQVPTLTARFAQPFAATAVVIAAALARAEGEQCPVAVLGIPLELDHG